jgi:hypothetical protein
MESAATVPADTAPPDPPKDPTAAILPGNIGGLLHVVHILLGYGRHLIDTVRRRSATPNFNALAACFGTANLSTIIAHLNRGILKCLALERILLARAATGRDIDYVERSSPTMQELLDRMDAPPEPAAAARPFPAERKRAPRPSRPAGWNDPELYMPTLEELERQMRRRPIGRIILDISLDLAVVPTLCHPAFWNALFDIMNWFGGGHAVSELMTEKTRRREAFAKEQDRVRGANWDWVNIPRDALRNVLGFFIGEPPVNPLDPAAAIATAPP